MSEPPSAGPARVLVVDDEPAITRALRASLEAAGYLVENAATAAEALERAASVPPDVVVLDMLLPDGGGLAVCRRLREWSAMPIVVVSGVDGEDDKIGALDAGADDYVTKPFAVGELLARIRAALRRSTPSRDGGVVRFGDVEVDLARRQVRRAGVAVHLAPREYDLLSALAASPGRVVTHRALLTALRGEEHAHETGYLRVYVAALRQKLEEDPSRPRHLITETGVGYRLVLEPW